MAETACPGRHNRVADRRCLGRTGGRRARSGRDRKATQRVGANLVDAQVDVPASGHQQGVDVRRERAEDDGRIVPLARALGCRSLSYVVSAFRRTVTEPS
jgi:hypothetical protein